MPSVPAWLTAWLNTVKAGYDRFAVCFEDLAENEDDLARLTSEDTVKLEEALRVAGASSLHVRNIRTALAAHAVHNVGRSTFASTSPVVLTAGCLISGRFVAMECVGSGGMGVVWKAQDNKNSGRLVALKATEEPPGLQRDKMTQRMEREADILQQLSSPNILQFIDRDLTVPCLVFEYIDGEALQTMIDRQDRRLKDPQTVLKAAIDITLGLAATHQDGFEHRDVKPGEGTTKTTLVQNSSG
jgi:hypothetical protein